MWAVSSLTIFHGKYRSRCSGLITCLYCVVYIPYRVSLSGMSHLPQSSSRWKPCFPRPIRSPSTFPSMAFRWSPLENSRSPYREDLFLASLSASRAFCSCSASAARRCSRSRSSSEAADCISASFRWRSSSSSLSLESLRRP